MERSERKSVTSKSGRKLLAKSRRHPIFHEIVDLLIFGGYQDPVYIIGGGTVRHSTNQQRTFDPSNLRAGNWLIARWERSVFVLND